MEITMNKVRLTREQEEMRLQGLRILARMIARHFLSNPDLYPQYVAGTSCQAPSESDCGKKEDVA